MFSKINQLRLSRPWSGSVKAPDVKASNCGGHPPKSYCLGILLPTDNVWKLFFSLTEEDRSLPIDV